MDTQKYYLCCNGQTEGPFSVQDLAQKWSNGEIAPDVLYAVDGATSWEPFSKLFGELVNASQKAPMLPAVPSLVPGTQKLMLVKSAKSRGVYIVLGLFLGCLGIHNFYAGYHRRGAGQLILSILLGWVLIGLVLTAIVALYEICTVKVDGQGDPFS